MENKIDAWYEEDEQVFVHPRDPYHRIDTLDSSRRVKVRVNGEVLAQTERPKILFETGLPPRYYIPPEDVREDVLLESEKTTGCPYKGVASYWSVEAGGERVEDLVWYYPDSIPEAAKIKGHLAFFNEKVDLEVDGEEQVRPKTQMVLGFNPARGPFCAAPRGRSRSFSGARGPCHGVCAGLW